MPEADGRQLINRLTELAERAERHSFWVHTEFLTLAEQDILRTLRLPLPYTLHAGYPGGERRIAAFGSEALFGFPFEPPVASIKIAPSSQKFAEELTHRDYLGALMALGIRREVMGDILIFENTGYLFCLDSIAQYIVDTLGEVRRTSVCCALSPPPQAAMEPPPITTLAVASERLDALISAVYRLPRSGGRELVELGRVYVDGRLAQSPSLSPTPGAIVSVRGKGRFAYEGIERETRKGRLRVRLRVY